MIAVRVAMLDHGDDIGLRQGVDQARLGQRGNDGKGHRRIRLPGDCNEPGELRRSTARVVVAAP
jgi:hypothetical protein